MIYLYQVSQNWIQSQLWGKVLSIKQRSGVSWQFGIIKNGALHEWTGHFHFWQYFKINEGVVATVRDFFNNSFNRKKWSRPWIVAEGPRTSTGHLGRQLDNSRRLLQPFLSKNLHYHDNKVQLTKLSLLATYSEESFLNVLWKNNNVGCWFFEQ